MSLIPVHATPRAGHNEAGGWRGAELSVHVTAAPDGGKANAAVERVLAEALGVPKSSVRVVRGATARHKLVEARGVSNEDVVAAFGEPDPALF